MVRKSQLVGSAAQLRKASAAYADRRRRAGWRRVAVWVPEDRIEELKAFADALGHAIDDASMR